jgi:hypothetical protein
LATTLILFSTALASGAQAQLINEIRIDQVGTDVDEYFEIAGPPNTALTGLTYLVVGDGTGGCGVIETVLPLGAFMLQADGLFAACLSAAPALAGYDALGVSSVAFENSDNLTHMLVSGFSGSVNQDLDTNNDGILDVTPWTSVLDCVVLIEDAVPGCGSPQSDDEPAYCTTRVGPDGTFVPGHVYRCGSQWLIGVFDPPGLTDTPGEPNNCAIPVENSTWSRVKTFYR